MRFYIGSSFKNVALVNFISNKLEEQGFLNAYNWTRYEGLDERLEEMRTYALAEKEAIATSDFVIILLPGGRGTHVELGLSIAFSKKVYLCSLSNEPFKAENAVAFYELPGIIKLTGNLDLLVAEIVSVQGKENATTPIP